MTSTFRKRLVIFTGCPGAGKSKAMENVSENHQVVVIPCYMTRPFRHGERGTREKKQISDEVYDKLLRQKRILFPTRTKGTEYRRGYPVLAEWEALTLDDEFRVLVCGPRTALKFYDLVPNTTCFFLTASKHILLNRIIYRSGPDLVAGHSAKIDEYEELGVEDVFRQKFGREHVIDTSDLDAEQVAYRIELLLGFNPLTLKRNI